MTALTLAALILWPAPVVVEPPAVVGWASAYAPGVMEATVTYRLENGLWWNTPPSRWIYADGYIATNDCTQVGAMLTLIAPDGRGYQVLVADCGGPGEGQGAAWMTENGIVAELDAALWETLTAAHGRPLRIELRN